MKRIPYVIVVVAMAAAACGGSSDSGAGETAAATTAAPTTTTAAPTTTAPPTTAAPSTTTAPPTTAAASSIVSGEDAEVDAIVTAYSVAFDSEADYAAKAPYIDDPTGLEDTVARYLETGDTMGGVSVLVTAVTVNGDEAEVAYDLLFNNNPTYPDLSGTAVMTDEGWKVPRRVFCSLMRSARVGCPAE